MSRTGADQRPPVEEEEEEEEEGEVVERARVALESEKLTGCRDSLREYLADRVQESHQYAYVMTVLAWIAGRDKSVWMTPDGGSVPPEERTELLSAAVNELGATDEAKKFRGDPGDPANLKSKIKHPVTAGAQRSTPWTTNNWRKRQQP